MKITPSRIASEQQTSSHEQKAHENMPFEAETNRSHSRADLIAQSFSKPRFHESSTGSWISQPYKTA